MAAPVALACCGNGQPGLHSAKESADMKISAGTIAWLIMGFIWSIFMGITAVSIGLGALYPPLNLVAKPFVCPIGQMTYQESESNPLPGTTYTTIGWYCVDNHSETTKPLDIFQIGVAAGTIYGLVIAVLVLIAVVYIRRQNTGAGRQNYITPAKHSAATGNHSTGGHPAHQAAPFEDRLARMKELKRLRSEQMISEAEYQKKRDEILKDL
jgi:hypothetical protein